MTKLELTATRPIAEMIADLDPGKNGISVLDLGYGMCKWPYGDTRITFCGAACGDGSSYCPEHAARAYMTARVWRP